MWLFLLFWPGSRNRTLWKEYAVLVKGDAEQRRALIYGPDFVEFLDFCKHQLPAGSTFHLAGVDYKDIARVRAFYYLYPCLDSDSPQYTLVFRISGYEVAGSSTYAALDASRYILKNPPQTAP